MLSILVAHSYFLRFDDKQRRRAKPYPPLATLQVAALLRSASHAVAFFDAMLAEGIDDYDATLDAARPTLQEGFSLAAGGGSAPKPAVTSRRENEPQTRHGWAFSLLAASGR